MEQFPLHQKDSGINRVVGFEPEREEEFLDYFNEKFEANSLESKEKEKTAEQLELIGRINAEMRDFLASYGIEAIEIPPENIHILDESKFTEEELKKFKEKFGTEHGFYSASKQSAVIMKNYEVSKLTFFQTLVHEAFHFQGFYSYQKSTPEAADLTLQNESESVSLNIRRSGFSIGTTDGKKLLFHKINESIITELEIRFEKAYMKEWPELAKDLAERDEYTEEVAIREGVPVERMRQMVAGIKKISPTEQHWVTYPYHDERLQFNSLVDDLFEKNRDDFSSREEVFGLFAEATLKGKLLPIARLIDKTFGKGSFRTAGEMTASERDLKKA